MRHSHNGWVNFGPPIFYCELIEKHFFLIKIRFSPSRIRAMSHYLEPPYEHLWNIYVASSLRYGFNRKKHFITESNCVDFMMGPFHHNMRVILTFGINIAGLSYIRL